MHAVTHQKHLAQSRRSTRSAVDIFNTLRVFTKQPIGGQEIKLERMNGNRIWLQLILIKGIFSDSTIIFLNDITGDQSNFFHFFCSTFGHFGITKKLIFFS